jgi:hypothetical protein
MRHRSILWLQQQEEEEAERIRAQHTERSRALLEQRERRLQRSAIMEPDSGTHKKSRESDSRGHSSDAPSS